MAKIKTLKESELFKDLSDKEIAVVSQIATEKTIPKNTPLFVENMLGESLFIIKSGSVQISKVIPEEGERNLLSLGPGDFFGEMALLNGGARMVSAKTIEETDLLVINHDDFKALMDKEPAGCLKFLQGIIKIFVNRIRDNTQLINEFIAWKAKSKGNGSDVLT
ncbi:MAG: cyclic nucleotide-binding domain-containing protein [Deltaproteobacteria bacterium]|nr:MAG: cyclic nucleotide-binding domain-containing protein [Deltaproteobacteria bacterium]